MQRTLLIAALLALALLYALAPVLVTFRSRPLSLVHVQNEIPEARGRLIATGSEYLLYKK